MGFPIVLGTGTRNSTTYLRGDGVWAAVSATVSALDDIGDVTITAIASGEILKWNGSAWINNTLAEAGIAAASHTHAASDITSGTLVHERGGLEADVSAYSGLVKITGGATSAVTVTAAGEALLDDAAASDQRTTLGLGTLATQSGTFSGTSSGTNTGDQTVYWGTTFGTGINLVDTTAAAAVHFIGGAASMQTIAPLSTATYARLIVHRRGTASGSGTDVMELMYQTSRQAAASGMLTMGSSAISVACNAADTVTDSGWIALVAGAKIDSCYVCPIASGGNGVANVNYGKIEAWFK